MQAKHLLFSLFLSSAIFVQAQPLSYQPTDPQQSLSFVENKGQVVDQYGNSRHDINYRLGGSGINIFVGSGQLHYQWGAPASKESGDSTEQRTAMYRMDVSLLGADPQAVAVAEQPQPFYERYYLPQFGEKGAIAHSFQKITYKEVYPNIDWVMYVKDNTVEYDFVVRPGGKVSDIKLQYGGSTNLTIDKAGRLTATTPMGSITEAAPISYEQDSRSPVSSFFTLNNNTVSFTTGDYSGTLVVDPTLSWSTYYGGTMDETIKNGSVTGDPFGNGYLAGYTSSTGNIATTGSFKDTLSGSTDGFLVKFDGSGVRKWATYYGGSSTEQVWGAASDQLGYVYLCGYTSSTGMATAGSHQAVTGGGQDAFLVKFDTAGVRQWSTYYGGTATEQGFAVTCDRSNNVYLTGYTNNSTTGVATAGAHQTTGGGGQDAFLVKFNSVGVRQWSTYYGGNSTDQGFALACDSNKNVFLAGYTNNSVAGIASTGAHQAAGGGGQDGFIAKFDSTGVRQWGTYYGGASTDRCLGIATDPAGSCYATGYTGSISGIATTGSHQPAFSGGTCCSDIFLVKLNSAGVRLWATYYGHTGDEFGNAVCSDALGHIYITGFTSSDSNIATTGAIKDTLDLQDAFIAKFDTSGSRIWGTYFGGEAGEVGTSIYCNSMSKLFVGGTTASLTNLATTGAHQTTKGGSINDAFLALINDCTLTAPASISGSDTVCKGGSYTYTVPTMPGASSYTWTIPGGWTGSSTSNTLVLTAGSTSDTIKVTVNYICGSSNQVTKPIKISPLPVINPFGTVAFCNGDSVTLTTGIGTTYQWLNSATPISGATAQNYTVHNSGYYRVVLTNALGCTDTSGIDTAIVHPLPVPVITATGTILNTGTFSGYQWKHNGTPITGATGNSYTVIVTSGLYTVAVIDTNGCEGTSTAFDASTLGIEEGTGKSTNVHIYPNPTTDLLHISSASAINVMISSMEGRVIAYYPNPTFIDMRNYAAGIYLLRITDHAGRSYNEKIVKHTNR